MNQPATRSDAKPGENAPEGCCLRVLHIEDDFLISQVVKMKLHSLPIPCQCTWAETREQFEAALRTGSFDVIISDSQVPGFDPYEALAYVREKHPEIPFIFFSAYSRPQIREDALKRGAAEYVGKDSPAQLIPALQRACPRARG